MQTIFQNIILHSAKCYIFMKNLDLFYEKLFYRHSKISRRFYDFCMCAKNAHKKDCTKTKYSSNAHKKRPNSMLTNVFKTNSNKKNTKRLITAKPNKLNAKITHIIGSTKRQVLTLFSS